VSYWTYETVPQSDRNKLYHRPTMVKLAGGGGLIYQSCRGFLNNQNSPWRVHSSDMLAVAGYAADTHALVVDTDPTSGTVNLYEVKSVAGYSYALSTPLMLTLEVLFADFSTDGATRSLKRKFMDNACTRDRVREFLHLDGGYTVGSWTRSRNSRTTAVLLLDDAWAHFHTDGDRG
jgi:hypothetical protein